MVGIFNTAQRRSQRVRRETPEPPVTGAEGYIANRCTPAHKKRKELIQNQKCFPH